MAKETEGKEFSAGELEDQTAAADAALTEEERAQGEQESEESQGQEEQGKEAGEEQPSRFKYRGKEYTLEELVAAGLLKDVLTTAEQFPHLQGKYQELLEERRAVEKPAAKPPTEGQPPAVTPEQIHAWAAPILAEAASGRMGAQVKEFAEAWPEPFAQFQFVIASLAGRLAAVEQSDGSRAQRELQTQAETAWNMFDETCNALAQDELFKPLASDGEARKDFEEWFNKLWGDQPLSKMTPELVQSQAAAYMREKWIESVKAQTSGKAQKTPVRRGAADTPAPRMGKRETPDELQRAMRELEKA